MTTRNEFLNQAQRDLNLISRRMGTILLVFSQGNRGGVHLYMILDDDTGREPFGVQRLYTAKEIAMVASAIRNGLEYMERHPV